VTPPDHDRRAALEAIRRRFNRPRYLGTDPLVLAVRYETDDDREVVGLLAACLAYGRVAQIHRSVEGVLDRMEGSPVTYLRTRGPAGIRRDVMGFRHRFSDHEDLAGLLLGMRRVLLREGSLGAAFRHGVRGSDLTVIPAAGRFVAELGVANRPGGFGLLPSPERGSACKRLFMYLRWMLRRDAIDPGTWGPGLTDRLIVPVDTHMHQVARRIGLTRRNAADLRTAVEITDAFRRIAPRDPVRYDFGLTRLGMRGELHLLGGLESRGFAPRS
jgi:uncharacterized protein (TIGR02757 family)